MEDNLKTNFKKVMEFNRAFDIVSQEPNNYSCYEEDCNGNIKCNPFKNIRKEIFTSTPFIIKLRLDIIIQKTPKLEELDKNNTYVLTGNGDVIEPEGNAAAIGSGGFFALAAARALVDHAPEYFTAHEIADKAMNIAADICVFSNHNIIFEKVV